MTISRGPAAVLAVGVALLFDVLRVFLPSLITLFGRAGETAPELMGAYAAAWFVLPFLALALRPRWALLGGAVALVLARILLQAGVSQLYVASAGVTAGLVFLYGCARTLPRTAVPAGIMGGLALSGIAHLLLDGVDLVWRDGLVPWLAVVTFCAAFLALVRLMEEPPAEPDLAPPATWFLFGPVLLLAGMAATSWAKDPAGPGSIWRVALEAGLLTPAFFAALAQTARRGLGPASDVLFAVLLVAVAVAFTMPSWSGGPASGALMILCLGPTLSATASPGTGARRSGLALLGGGLVFLVGLFLYYAAYDLDLGFPNGAVVIAVAVLVAAVAVSTALRRPAPTGRKTRPGWRAVVIVATATVLAVAVAWRPAPPVQAKRGDTIKLIAYNIRMGFGLDGRLSLDRIAAWARSQQPDVVLLSEVDRGWLLNGGHDDLARIARGLGMRYHFARAADNVWGDALLTNLPVKSVSSHPLGAHDYPTGAQAQAIVLDVDGRELGIVNTHLQAPAGQAPEVAAIVRNLAAGADSAASGPGTPPPAGRGIVRPVVLAGDLNLEPGDQPMRMLAEAGVSDPLTALGDPKTSPADNPVRRIDHVLITKGLTAVSAQVPRVPYSDHLPVLTTLRLTSVDQGG
ncbi:metal-dependent hydrolase [Nonomuraea sp. NN258]|uniref:endonuclease/exonuclease/phosphatase family protein n=1 Tax=Nonomuraea antri TaxID=2730852 RepID=UPI001567DA49|nr:endonuclease/exonuclease/phosphatase family protein [Nonomuraea antri]NRQ37036.1 metal-dependent hydrolase [Nonomuraea antri]